MNYKSSLKDLHLETLKERRKNLYVTFAKRATMNEKVKIMFPIRKEIQSDKRRHTERFQVLKANTERLRRSSIPFMQNLLNTHYSMKKQMS